MKIGTVNISKKLTTVIFAIVVLVADQWLDLGIDAQFRETLSKLVMTYLVVQGGADVVQGGIDAKTRQMTQLAEQANKAELAELAIENTAEASVEP